VGCKRERGTFNRYGQFSGKICGRKGGNLEGGYGRYDNVLFLLRQRERNLSAKEEFMIWERGLKKASATREKRGTDHSITAKLAGKKRGEGGMS